MSSESARRGFFSESEREYPRPKPQRAQSELSFNSQDEVDDFNQLRFGYKSVMTGFGEDMFINLLITQYTLESELEKMKEQLAFRC
mmetsp:Transcript_6235/g.10158  ORF Transcript_6235/g.10158 Transcript_6235/m.10158 type:complete len:86 (-) Transcript_6235:678-935(-)